jgi:ABC-type uncharacterized transport system substrate-binding protein
MAGTRALRSRAARRNCCVALAKALLDTEWPETAEEGGLAAYGPRFTQIYRQLARQLVNVLRGAKPADIPVEQPTSFVSPGALSRANLQSAARSA